MIKSDIHDSDMNKYYNSIVATCWLYIEYMAFRIGQIQPSIDY